MLYNKIKLKERNYTALLTEIFFNVASERVCGTELVRFDIPKPQDKYDTKAYPAALRIMKYAKKRDFIRIYLTEKGFFDNSTESLYMQNLYGHLIENDDKPEGYDFIYVKI